MTLSAAAKVILTVLSDDRNSNPDEMALWDRSSAKLIRRIKVRGLVQAVLLPQTEILAVGTDEGDLALLDAVTGVELHRARIQDGPVATLVVAPDRRHLAALGPDWMQLWALTKAT